MVDRWYPEKIIAGDMDGGYDESTVRFVRDTFGPAANITIAEFGIWKGATTFRLAELMQGNGTIHIFDYEDNVSSVKAQLAERGYHNVVAHGSSYKYLDSYNGKLRILHQNRRPVFDSAYLDGAHTCAVDALNFLLVDLLLKPDGYVKFDEWRMRGSSLDPATAHHGPAVHR